MNVKALILININTLAFKICKQELKRGWYLKVHSFHTLSVWIWIT